MAQILLAVFEEGQEEKRKLREGRGEFMLFPSILDPPDYYESIENNT